MILSRRADELMRAYDATFGLASDDERQLLADLAIAAGWGARDREAALLPSGVSHGVPWGLSMVPGSTERRVFLEAQSDPPSAAGYRAEAARLTSEMERRGADASLLHRVLATVDADPVEGRAVRVWHAVAIDGAAVRFHAYVVLPPSDRPRLARALLDELGIGSVALRPPDRISIVSLDLPGDGVKSVKLARVKTYVLMPDAPAADLAALHDRARDAVVGDAEHFAAAMIGDRRIWWLASLGWQPGEESPRTCTLHFGVPRHLDEPTAVERVRALLEAHELPTDAWDRARKPGHHFVTFQRAAGRPRVTTYFLPEVRR